MKRLHTYRMALACFVSLALAFSACGHEADEAHFSAPPYAPPLFSPHRSDTTLRILVIGNSYAENATEMIPLLLDGAEISVYDGCCLYVAAIGSASLKLWYNYYKADSVVHCNKVIEEAGIRSEGTLTELFAQPWDIISFQQYSIQSTDYATFHPFLDSLVACARRLCTNPEVSIAWHQTWSHDNNSERMYERIVNASARLYADGLVDLLIPSGTAIQNARQTSLNTSHNLTRDGTHLTYAAGLYVAACTWFETLFMPVFEKSVLGNTAVRRATDREKQASPYETVDVTPENSELYQRCAVAAVANPFGITFIEDTYTAL